MVIEWLMMIMTRVQRVTNISFLCQNPIWRSMVLPLVVSLQSSITTRSSRIVFQDGRGFDIILSLIHNWLFLSRQIGGKQIGLFIYTNRQVSSGEELRYNYNVRGQTENSIAFWRPSPFGFCSRQEVLAFLADVKFVNVEKLRSASVTRCLQLMIEKIPGRFIVMSLQDCAQFAGSAETGGLRRCRNFMWMLTVCFLQLS